MRILPSALLALALVPVTLAAGPRRTWDFATFSYVQIRPAEKGAPANAHPLQVDPTALGQALAALKFTSGGKDAPLFVASEVEGLSRALAEALAVAGPGEDLEVLSTTRRDKGFFGDALGVVARAFAQDGKVNLIVHDARLDYVYIYNYESRMPTFNYGSRAAAGAVTLKGADLRRPDWAVLNLAAAPVPAAPVAAAPTAPTAPAAPAPPPSVEERLKGLKRFHEQGLITEAEYAKQKADLLKEYAQGAPARTNQ